MDSKTFAHFAAWLDNNFHAAAERREVKRCILALLEDYPELLESHSWWEMYDMARDRYAA